MQTLHEYELSEKQNSYNDEHDFSTLEKIFRGIVHTYGCGFRDVEICQILRQTTDERLHYSGAIIEHAIVHSLVLCQIFHRFPSQEY